MKFLKSAHSGLDPAPSSDLDRSKLWPLASKLPQTAGTTASTSKVCLWSPRRWFMSGEGKTKKQLKPRGGVWRSWLTLRTGIAGFPEQLCLWFWRLRVEEYIWVDAGPVAHYWTVTDCPRHTGGYSRRKSQPGQLDKRHWKGCLSWERGLPSWPYKRRVGHPRWSSWGASCASYMGLASQRGHSPLTMPVTQVLVNAVI